MFTSITLVTALGSPGGTSTWLDRLPPELSFCGNVSITDCVSLLALHASTHGSSWDRVGSWLHPTRGACQWQGVSCGDGGGGKKRRVVGLTLADNGLRGSIPAAIATLTELVNLDLSDNELRGTMPAALGEMTKLRRLWLHGNKISGSLPAYLPSTLEWLEAQINLLDGVIPATLPPNLRKLALNDNKMSGTLPPTLFQPNLVTLSLQSNALSGTFPETVESATSLRLLRADANKLSGSLPSPAALAKMHSLRSLLVQDNKLDDGVSATLCGMQLQFCNMSGNAFVCHEDHALCAVAKCSAHCSALSPAASSL